MLLSIIIPVFNEVNSLVKVVDRALTVDLPNGIARELIVVDDGSTDGTSELLRQCKNNPLVKVHHSVLNFGKGVAVRVALRYASGDIVAIQDADLEYDPIHLSALVTPLLNGQAKVVYGSRFLGKASGMVLLQGWGNRILTAFSNFLFQGTLTDAYTCYKVFDRTTADWLSRQLVSRGFELEAEITARLLRAGFEIQELPVIYQARSHQQGKKIRAGDGIKGLWMMLRLKLFVK